MTHEPPPLPQLALSDIMHTMSPSPGPLVNEVDEDADAEGERDEGVEEPDSRQDQEHCEVEAGGNVRNSVYGATVEGKAKARSASPEFIGLEEFLHMRKRVLEIRSEIGGEGHGGGGSTRERELADMVLRLTSSSSGPSDSAQLAIQADTISRLLAQRDFLIRGAEEERARWEAEREGWHRTAEALIAARGGSRTGSSATREELEKKRTWLESDNKALRFKLQDTQERLTTLESELSKLKPILLMQPFPTAATHTLASLNHSAAFLSSIPYPSVRGSGKMIHKSSGRRKIKTTLATGDGTSTDSLQPIANPNTGDHYRKPEVPQALSSTSTEVPSPSKKSHHPNAPSSAKKTPQTPPALPSLPLASDARAEHLLLAARKIGRERTSVVAGIVRVRQQELERERIERERAEREKDRAEREMERLERLKSGVSYYRKEGETKSVKTPKRVFVQWFQPPDRRPTPEPDPEEDANQLSSPAVAGPSNQGHASGLEQGQNQIHGQVHTPARQVVPDPPPNPQTPLDSLWNAAQSMMDDQPEAESSAMATRSMLNGRRHASAMDQLESPVPKRRRVSKVLGSGTSISRVRSALDVLADQADQASAVGPGSGPQRGIDDNYDGDGGATVSEAVGPESSQEAREGRKGKGKGKEKEKDTVGEDAKQKAKPKATPVKRVRARAPPKEKPTPKGKARASNSESAMPRMISPPALHDGGVRAPGQLYMPDGASPTKMAPGSGRGTPWKGRTRPRPSDTADTSFDDQARVSLRPVTGWGERGDEEGEDRTDTPTRSQEVDAAGRSATDRPGLVQLEANSDNIVPKSTAGGDPIHHNAINQLEPGSQSTDNDQNDQAPVIPPIGLPNSPLPSSVTIPIPSQINNIVHGTSGLNGDADADCDMDADGDVDVDAEGDPDLEELPEGSPEFQEHFHNATDPLPSTATIPAIITLVPSPIFMASSLTAPPPHLESQATPMVSPLRTDTAPPITTTVPDINQIVSSSSPRSDTRTGSPDYKTGQAPATVPGKRGRTTYVKWTKEEDELLAEAVAKYGQKWELVQRDLPTRGYHQVRQRWLGKLMAFDNNPDGAQPHPAFPKSGYTDSPTGSQTPKPKLGLAPLNHELSFTNHVAPSTSALSTGPQN